ncbi:MAG: GNAT family N-acetyltransferase, partial [Ktedonobacterales bacterium]
DANPDDGMPWLGVLQIASSYHRRGLGAEAFKRLVAYFRADCGWGTLRLGIRTQNAPALAFWRHLGFTQVGGGDGGTPVGEFVILEYHL